MKECKLVIQLKVLLTETWGYLTDTTGNKNAA